MPVTFSPLFSKSIHSLNTYSIMKDFKINDNVTFDTKMLEVFKLAYRKADDYKKNVLSHANDVGIVIMVRHSIVYVLFPDHTQLALSQNWLINLTANQ